MNEFFQLPNFPEPVGGWEKHEFFHPYDPNLASALLLNESGVWRNAPGDAPTVGDNMEKNQGQDLGYQEAAPHEHEQSRAQPQLYDRILAAMEGMEARFNTHLDVMEAGMIVMESRLNIGMDAMVDHMDRINRTLHQTYARSQAGPQLD
ncbi:hypothetical protein ACOSQ3_027614 [Xanthoceras sorbifolium]